MREIEATMLRLSATAFGRILETSVLMLVQMSGQSTNFM